MKLFQMYDWFGPVAHNHSILGDLFGWLLCLDANRKMKPFNLNRV